MEKYLIQGAFDNDLFQNLKQKGILNQNSQDLMKYVNKIENQYYHTTEDIDTISICRQILVQTYQKIKHDEIAKGDYLTTAAKRIAQNQPKTEQRFNICLKLLKKATQYDGSSWYFNPEFLLLKLTTLPSHYGFDNKLASQELADYAYKELIDLNPADLVIALRDWLGNFILGIIGEIPQRAFDRTNQILDYLSIQPLSQQYKGEVYFLQGFNLQYIGSKDKSTFDKIVNFYQKSLATTNQKNSYEPTPAIQSGKYMAMFHYAKLLNNPQIYGFNKSWGNPNKARQIQNMKNQLLANKQADKWHQVLRLMGWQGNKNKTARWINNKLGQSDNLDQNYIKAMDLLDNIVNTMTLQQDHFADIHNYRAWLFLNKSHLFKNYEQNAVEAIIKSLNHYQSFIQKKKLGTQNFKQSHLQLGLMILYSSKCKDCSKLKQLKSIIDKIRKTYSQRVSTIIDLYTTIYNVVENKKTNNSYSATISRQIIQKSIDSGKALAPQVKSQAQLVSVRAQLISQLLQAQNQDVCQKYNSYLSGYLQTCQGEYSSSSMIQYGKFQLDTSNNIATLLSYGAGFVPYIGDFLSKSIQVVSSVWIQTQITQQSKNVQNIARSLPTYLLIMEVCILRHIKEQEKKILNYKSEVGACQSFFSTIKKYINSKGIKIPDNIEQVFLQNTNNEFKQFGQRQGLKLMSLLKTGEYVGYEKGKCFLTPKAVKVVTEVMNTLYYPQIKLGKKVNNPEYANDEGKGSKYLQPNTSSTKLNRPDDVYKHSKCCQSCQLI